LRVLIMLIHFSVPAERGWTARTLHCRISSIAEAATVLADILATTRKQRSRLSQLRVFGWATLCRADGRDRFARWSLSMRSPN